MSSESKLIVDSDFDVWSEDGSLICVCRIPDADSADRFMRKLTDRYNNHERLVEALREVADELDSWHSAEWAKQGGPYMPPCEETKKARALLAALEAEKGGEL